MNLLEFTKLIKRNLYIEIRPNSEVIISFGADCDLMESDLLGKSKHRHESIHGRGQSLNEATKDLIEKMSDKNKMYILKFAPSFDGPREHRVENLEHIDNLIQ